MNKNRIKPEQLDAMKQALYDQRFCTNFQYARAVAEKIGLHDETEFYTEDEKRTALRFRAFLYDPADYGVNGKLNEIEHRINRSIVTRSTIPWGAYRARPHNKPDQVMIANGRRYIIEHKTTRGDWASVHTDDIEQALDEYATSEKWLCWENEEFTLFMPISEFMEKLAGYKLGVRTFFCKMLKYQPMQGTYCLQLQNWSNSPKKVAFLQSIAATGYNYKLFEQTNVLERL